MLPSLHQFSIKKASHAGSGKARNSSVQETSNIRGLDGMTEDKITREGQPCRHCGTLVVKKTNTNTPTPKPSGYYFEWWFKCPNVKCKAIYMDESAKRLFDRNSLSKPISPRFAARSAGQAMVESSMRQLLSQPRSEPFVHGPAPDAHGDALVPPWISYPERQAWIDEHYTGETL